MRNENGGRRVVVTGLGIISPLGLEVDKFWNNLISGKSGVSRIEHFDVEKIASRIAAQIKDFKPEDYIDFKQARRMDRFAQFAVAAASDAIKDSGLKIDPVNEDKIGVLIGSGVGGLATLEQQHEKLLSKGADKVSPFVIPMMICNMAAAQVSIISGAKGPVGTTTTACAAGSNAIGDAFEIIKRGDAEIMIAGGSEAAITPLGMAGFSNMQALSSRNDEPEKASRPFDKDRDGFVMGEGCGILILEELKSALKRDARIYCEIFGYGLSGEAYHITALEESGVNAARCMKNCLNEGEIKLEEVDYINAHGTATPLNDAIETAAIKRCFGEYAYNINISSTKSMVGHCLGASGAIEAVSVVLTIINDTIPPTINLDNPDEKCDLNYTAKVSQKREVNMAISNSMGFGGHNVTLGFKKYL
ncbi:MAG: beta-ketoacyl-[acyl-carrier-protein] synthase II [Actinobacteria bacterium RBG_19FT_COMBO_36_27]|nr:MAG: beta-ketoacyl-[acyl-carrier-protein] synthase II [Actinobacteria bacterium RBG_19FT_COMBO_36_27]